MSENRPNLGADLIRIHAVITRGVAVVQDRGRVFAAEGLPNAAALDGLVKYLRSLAGTLHAHHLSEDEVVFPVLHERLPAMPFAQLAAEHAVVQRVLDELAPAIDRLAAGPWQAPELAPVLRLADRLADLWAPHMAIEEAYLTPATADALLSVEEQMALGQRAAQHSQEHAGPAPLIVPFMLYNLPPVERAVMAGRMPPAVTQQLLPGPWKEQWAAMQPFLLA